MRKFKLSFFVGVDLFRKVVFISKFYHQSVSGLIVSLIVAYVNDFESENGVIEVNNG